MCGEGRGWVGGGEREGGRRRGGRGGGREGRRRRGEGEGGGKREKNVGSGGEAFSGRFTDGVERAPVSNPHNIKVILKSPRKPKMKPYPMKHAPLENTHFQPPPQNTPLFKTPTFTHLDGLHLVESRSERQGRHVDMLCVDVFCELLVHVHPVL